MLTRQVQGSGFKVQGSGFKVLGFKVLGFKANALRSPSKGALNLEP
jgi:hypothetical protein